MDKQISSNSKVAYYLQLKEIIRNQIDSGVLKPGDLLPTEAGLCEKYKVSRTVVRQALMELENEGAVYKRRGKGTFINRVEIKIALTHLKTSFGNNLRPYNPKTISEILKKEVITPPLNALRMMDLKPSEKVIHIEQVLSQQGERHSLVNTYLRSPLCDPMLEADLLIPLYENLRTVCRLDSIKGERVIEAVGASKDESQRLSIPVGSPLLKVTRISSLDDDTVIEYTVAIHRGDRSSIEASVVHFTNHKRNLYTSSDPSNLVTLNSD